MVKFLSSLALVAGLAVAGAANAATYNLGTLAEGVTQFGPNVIHGGFSDTLDFTIGSASNLAAGLGQLSFSLGSTPYLGIGNLNLTLYNSSNVDLGSGTDVVVNNLSAGNYYAVISGKTYGSGGGEYGGAISISAVPEVSTMAMMLAGLGMLGCAVVRRKS
jgi:hypothetical protein